MIILSGSMLTSRTKPKFSNLSRTTKKVNYGEYQDGIKVGAVNIDSGWSTKYSNFEWDFKKFPNPKNMIDSFHSQGIKVMLVTIA